MSEFLDWGEIEPPREIHVKRLPSGGRTIFLDDIELPFHVLGDIEVYNPVDDDQELPTLTISLVALDRVVDETGGKPWYFDNDDEDEDALFEAHDVLAKAENVDVIE